MKMTDPTLPLVEPDIISICNDAQNAIRSKEWQVAFEMLERVLKDDPVDWPLQAILDLGTAATQLGRFEQAGLAYSLARKRDTQNLAAWRGGAFAASRRGAWDETVQLWQGCIALSPKDSQPEWWWSSLGDALGKLERWEEAASSYANMRERWPDSPLGWRGGAFVASRVADWAAAADLWQGCIARSTLDGQQLWWWSGLADALSRLGRHDEAANAYEKLRQRWPTSLAGWQGGARVAMLAGDWANAASMWRRIMELQPEAAQSAANMAAAIIAHLRARNCEIARTLLAEMTGRWPEDPSCFRNLVGQISKDSGPRRAARMLAEVGFPMVALPPAYEKPVIDMLLQAGRYPAASERIARWSLRHGKDAQWLSAVIDYHKALGDYRAALAEVERALDNPEHREKLTADEVALFAYNAALGMNEATRLLRKWYGEGEVSEAVGKVYSLPLAGQETTSLDWKPPKLTGSWKDYHKLSKQKFQKFQANRQYALFRDFVDHSVKKASLLRLRRLLAVSTGRFPNANTSTRLKSIVENRTVPASETNEAFGSRWRIALPPPELSIASQLAGRPWRRLVCMVPIRNEEEILLDFIDHYRRLGVESFIVIDNGSDQDPAVLLDRIKDCEITLVRVPCRFSAARHGTMWSNEVAELGLCDWLLLSDCDERLIYPGWSSTPIGQLLDHLDSRGDTALFGVMLDVFDADFGGGGRISDDINKHVLINADLASEASLKAPWKTIQGGIRRSIASNLEKTPLLKVSAGVRCTGNHTVTSCQLAETNGAFIHLKLFRDRNLLDMSAEQVAQDSRVRDRALNCVARHLAFQGLANSQDRVSPFQVEVSETQLMKMGYMCADAGWRAKVRHPMAENLAVKADNLSWPGRERVAKGTSFQFRSTPLPELIEELCDAAFHLSRADLRTLIRSHFARITRREVKLAVLLPVVIEQGRHELAKRILRRLRTSMEDENPCLAGLGAAAERLKPYRALEKELLEMAVRAGHASGPLLATLSRHYSWVGQYAKANSMLSGVETSIEDGTISARLRALQGIGDWDSYIHVLNEALSRPHEQSYWRLLSPINQCPFAAEREALLNKLLERLNPSMQGAEATAYLSILLLLGQSDKLMSVFPSLSEGLPMKSRRYFERVIAARTDKIVFNRYWCIGLSKTGTTSFHDYCTSIGLMSAHFTNPVLHFLITREDADVFDVVSDTSVVLLARTCGVPDRRAVIHTTRQFEAWSRSYLYHFGRAFGVPDAKFEEIKDQFQSKGALRFGETWSDIHSTLYFNFNSLRQAYEYQHDWVRELASKGMPFLEVPLEAPNELKAKMVSRFVGCPDKITTYPVSNEASRFS